MAVGKKLESFLKKHMKEVLVYYVGNVIKENESRYLCTDFDRGTGFR